MSNDIIWHEPGIIFSLSLYVLPLFLLYLFYFTSFIFPLSNIFYRFSLIDLNGIFEVFKWRTLKYLFYLTYLFQLAWTGLFVHDDFYHQTGWIYILFYLYSNNKFWNLNVFILLFIVCVFWKMSTTILETIIYVNKHAKQFYVRLARYIFGHWKVMKDCIWMSLEFAQI